MIAKASGKAAKSASPPSTSHVSLPSQIGAIEFMTRLRESPIGREAIEDADAQIEAVEQHVEKYASPSTSVQIGTKSRTGGLIAAPPSRRRERLDRLRGRPPSIGSGSAAASAGPCRTSLAISAKPAENMTRYTRQ